jgi:hypothetical protein
LSGIQSRLNGAEARTATAQVVVDYQSAIGTLSSDGGGGRENSDDESSARDGTGFGHRPLPPGVWQAISLPAGTRCAEVNKDPNQP